MCAGCHTQWGHLKPHPCEQARWAMRVRAHTRHTDARKVVS
jgi:hypothetical protein